MYFIFFAVFISMGKIVSLPIQPRTNNLLKHHKDVKGVLNLFQSSPMDLISMMQKVDPAQLNHIIGLLENMLIDSQQLETDLREEVDTKSVELAQAVLDVEGSKQALEEINEKQTAAKIKLDEASTTVNKKEGALTLAQKELAHQQPSLLEEQKVLRQVIGMLTGLVSSDQGCISHTNCSDDQFCYHGECAVCRECHYNHDAIDGVCPAKCPALCEDVPPQYPKCPLCQSQEECDSQNPHEFYPHCETDDKKCLISTPCNDEAHGYLQIAKDAAMKWLAQNPNATHIPDDAFPAATAKFCQCMSDQIHCLMDNHCLTKKSKDEMKGEIQNDPAYFENMCTNDMKCRRDQCSWIPRATQYVSFLSNYLRLK